MNYLEFARTLASKHNLPVDFELEIEGLNMLFSLSLQIKADNGEQQKVTRGLREV